jgi:hypothetical protein
MVFQAGTTESSFGGHVKGGEGKKVPDSNQFEALVANGSMAAAGL